MNRQKKKAVSIPDVQIDERSLFANVAEIIESRKIRAGSYVNREATLMYWEVGWYINSVVLDGGRAGYGKRIVALLAQQFVKNYGKAFEIHNIRRMMRFAENFNNLSIVTPLASQSGWSRFIGILPLLAANLFERNTVYA